MTPPLAFKRPKVFRHFPAEYFHFRPILLAAFGDVTSMTSIGHTVASKDHFSTHCITFAAIRIFQNILPVVFGTWVKYFAVGCE